MSDPAQSAARSSGSADENVAYPEDLRAKERALIARRRKAAGIDDAPKDGDDPVAVCLSGGGIRSATFCLGVFQALARLKLVRRIDLLSTVSGGGYFGSFLGRLFTRDDVAARQGAPAAARVEATLVGDEKPEVVRHLRENGRYLAPNGAGDLLTATAIVVRNWVALHVVLFCAAMTVLLSATLLRGVVDRTGELVSLWWIAAAACCGLITAPPGIAYWLVRGKTDDPTKRGDFVGWAGAAAAAGVFGGLAAPAIQAPASLLGGVGLCVVAAAAVFAFCMRNEELPAARRKLGDWTARGLAWTALCVAFGAVETAAEAIYAGTKSAGGEGLSAKAAGAGAALAAAASTIRPLIGVLGLRRDDGDRRPGLPLKAVTGGALVVVGGGLLLAAATVAQGFAHGFGAPGPGGSPAAFLPGVFALVAFAAVSYLMGNSATLANLTSQHPFYSARLTRAYLGASNPDRHRPNTKTGKPVAITDPDDGDDFAEAKYWNTKSGASPQDKGAPLHFVNVTVNETVDGKSQIQQQDRKGLGLAVGPCARSLGVRHHQFRDATPTPDDAAESGKAVPADKAAETDKATKPNKPPRYAFQEAKEPEPLKLGAWVGISGAAFSTGIGARTSLATSVLCGLANVRLGYWWDCGDHGRDGGGRWMKRALLKFFPVQALIVSELLARFPGTAWRRWYLSDGGHFENMGGYELVRRRARRIVMIDAEQDADYSYEGLANFVRKARVDFGADVRFLSDDELNARVAAPLRKLFGPPEALRRGAWGELPQNPVSKGGKGTVFESPRRDALSLARCALADVLYADGTRGKLLYVKPTLTGDEPVDVTQYHANHPDFPHETTADQFFDEEQWESYRALGEHIGTALFSARGESRGFRPSDVFLKPSPPAAGTP